MNNKKKQYALNWSGGGPANFVFDFVGEVLQAVIRDNQDPDQYRVLFDGYDLALIAAGARNHTAMIIARNKAKKRLIELDTDPRALQSNGRLESILYTRNGAILYHRFLPSIDIVVVTINNKSAGFLTAALAFDERGFR